MSGVTGSPLILGGIRNVLLGGDFSANPLQRGSSFTITGGGQYTADRWYAARGSGASGQTIGIGSLSIGDIPGTLKFLRSQRDSGNSSTQICTVSQSVLSKESVPLTQRSITLSFWARKGSDFTGSLAAQVIFGQGVNENVVTGFTGSTSVTMTVPLTTSWQKFDLTCAAGGFTQIAAFFYHTPTGTASTNDWFDLALIQLAPTLPGSPFLHRSYQEELRLCQHFFVARTGANDSYFFTLSSTSFGGSVTFPVTMFDVPDIDIYNTNTIDQCETQPGSGTLATGLVFGRSVRGFSLMPVSSTAGLVACQFNYEATAEF